jgi:hypothetical protein
MRGPVLLKSTTIRGPSLFPANEPDDLPTNDEVKYQHQMSFYKILISSALLLQEGMIIFLKIS